MINDFLSRWNPFNAFGPEIELEDLLLHPLETNETLMQDGRGCIHRIKVPSSQSPTWEAAVFWIQTHLNKSGHLDAIDKLISIFQTRILDYSFLPPTEFKWIKSQVECLRSLKNDYCFQCLQAGDPQSVDLKLQEIENQAFLVFERTIQQTACEQEEKRKRDFLNFKENVHAFLSGLEQDYQASLHKTRLLLIASPRYLAEFFEERVRHIKERLSGAVKISDKIDQIEKDHQGKFTIPFLNEHLLQMRRGLWEEVDKIGKETHILIESLKTSYRINPFKEQIAALLATIQVDPEEIRGSLLETIYLPKGMLQREIEQTKRHLKDSIEKHRR